MLCAQSTKLGHLKYVYVGHLNKYFSSPCPYSPPLLLAPVVSEQCVGDQRSWLCPDRILSPDGNMNTTNTIHTQK